MAAKDCYASQDGPIGSECVVIDCIASGTCRQGYVALLSVAAADNDPRPTVIESDAQDSAAVVGVFAETKTTGLNVRVIKYGRAKVIVTSTTPAIAVGQYVASSNKGGAKLAATQTSADKNLGQAFQAAATVLDEILIFVNK